MENLITVLRIFSESWPLAVMVVAMSGAIVVRRSIKQGLENQRLKELDRSSGNHAVVVHPSRHADD